MEFYLKTYVSLILLFLPTSLCGNGKLLREYIGAEGLNVKFSDVPINENIEVHFILSFAIDYTNSACSPSPTNGNFNVFWDTQNLSPADVLEIKSKHKNVKFAVSLGGDKVGEDHTDVQFNTSSVSSWTSNAVSSLTKIIKQYHLDGIDIDYEHFDHSDPNTFAKCVGELILQLKQQKVISMASIAPFEDEGPVQSHYKAVWRKYGQFIDYVNFQFYAYDRSTSVNQFLKYFDTQASNYKGGKLLSSFTTDSGSGGLKPDKGFFDACKELKKRGKLEGIFIWSADDSKNYDFKYEVEAQAILASA
ncbi:hypothetical protein SUGI_0031720 [Cryptomeria japonica]|nr:hypothetical protein SUGI_0031720 [Cryptomeria japonica]